jgi:hypothetical protein
MPLNAMYANSVSVYLDLFAFISLLSSHFYAFICLYEIIRVIQRQHKGFSLPTKKVTTQNYAVNVREIMGPR